jgi:hypothetical protein
MTPEEHAEWLAAYAAKLAGPGDEGEVLRRAAERTAHLWGFRIAPDGTPVVSFPADPEAEPEAEIG